MIPSIMRDDTSIVCYVEGLYENKNVLFFLASLNVYRASACCQLPCGSDKKKQEELQRPHNICFLSPFSPFRHAAAASLRVRITHWFLRIGDIVCKHSGREMASHQRHQQQV